MDPVFECTAQHLVIVVLPETQSQASTKTAS